MGRPHLCNIERLKMTATPADTTRHKTIAQFRTVLNRSLLKLLNRTVINRSLLNVLNHQATVHQAALGRQLL